MSLQGCPYKRLYAEAHLQAHLRERSPHGVSQTVWGNEAQVSTMLRELLASGARGVGTATHTAAEKGLAGAKRLMKSVRGFQELRVLSVGLDGVGRTTGLYQLKLGEVVTTIPSEQQQLNSFSRLPPALIVSQSALCMLPPRATTDAARLSACPPFAWRSHMLYVPGTRVSYEMNCYFTHGRSVAAIGFNVETIEYRNAEICIWDVGGESACLPACLPVWRLASNPSV